MNEHPEKPVAGTAPRFGKIVPWLAMAAIAVAALSFAAVSAPPRFKLLGLFTIAQGALAGWILGRVARMNDVRSVRPIWFLGALLIATGLIGTTLDAHRRYAAVVREAYAADPQAAIMLRALRQPPAGGKGESDDSAADDLFQKAADERRRALAERTAFSAYLKHRIEPLGDWPTSAAAMFWLAEVLTGSLAGAWVARLTASQAA